MDLCVGHFRTLEQKFPADIEQDPATRRASRDWRFTIFPIQIFVRTWPRPTAAVDFDI